MRNKGEHSQARRPQLQAAVELDIFHIELKAFKTRRSLLSVA